MNNIALNLNFIKNKQYWNTTEQIPYVKAVAGLMILTGVYRLFEKEDVEQLLKRAQLLLPERQIIDRFFSDESLFGFRFNDLQYEFTTDHLKELIGLETLDADKNRIPFSEWIYKVKGCIDMYHLLIGFGVFESLELTAFSSHVTPTDQGVDIDISKTSDFELTLTHELLDHAELLGKTVIKELPSSLFTRIKEVFPNKIKALELRELPFDEPIFDFEKLPLEMQRQLWKHFWPDMVYFNDKDQRNETAKLIYLAWLWANEFVIEDSDGLPYVDPRMESFKLDDYELDDGGFNLYITYEEHDLEALATLLYSPEVAKLSERPWEKLDVYKKKDHL